MTEPSDPRRATYRDARATRVLARIAAACARARSRDPSTVPLVAVSKTVAADGCGPRWRPASTPRREPRPGGRAKAPERPRRAWQLVGPLQSNKARRALEVFDVIQSVDSVDARASARPPRGRGPAGRAATRSSSRSTSTTTRPRPASRRPTCRRRARRAARAAATSRSRPDDGRPADVGPGGGALDVPRPARAVGAAPRPRGRPSGRTLSMGMTDDFEVAVEEGATIVRVGRALFGERPHAGRAARDSRGRRRTPQRLGS